MVGSGKAVMPLRIPISDHLRAGTHLASDTKTNALQHSRWPHDHTGSGVGPSRRLWNTWWQNPGPHSLRFPEKGRRRGRNNQRGRGWPSMSSCTGGNPDPTPRQILLGFSFNRRRKRPSNMGWAGMWALRLGIWKTI